MIFFSFESQIYFWLQKHRFWHSLFYCVLFFVLYIWGFFFQRGVLAERSMFFFFLLLSLFMCPGIARNFFTIFLAHSSSEYILYLSYDLFCDRQVSFYINFLLQFSFSELSVTSGLFLLKVKPCCNLLKCYSYFLITVFFFMYLCQLGD